MLARGCRLSLCCTLSMFVGSLLCVFRMILTCELISVRLSPCPLPHRVCTTAVFAQVQSRDGQVSSVCRAPEQFYSEKSGRFVPCELFLLSTSLFQIPMVVQNKALFISAEVRSLGDDDECSF